MEIILENGETENKKEIVMRKWGKDFSDLFSGNYISPGFNDVHLNNIHVKKCKSEMIMDTPDCCPNIFLNHEITMEEVKRAIDNAKLKKASGIEGIPNEALKTLQLLEILFHLFKTCFDHGIIPSTWHKTIIKPVPKPSRNDPRMPLNYRGISLLIQPINCIPIY